MLLKIEAANFSKGIAIGPKIAPIKRILHTKPKGSFSTLSFA